MHTILFEEGFFILYAIHANQNKKKIIVVHIFFAINKVISDTHLLSKCLLELEAYSKLFMLWKLPLIYVG